MAMGKGLHLGYTPARRGLPPTSPRPRPRSARAEVNALMVLHDLNSSDDDSSDDDEEGAGGCCERQSDDKAVKPTSRGTTLSSCGSFDVVEEEEVMVECEQSSDGGNQTDDEPSSDGASAVAVRLRGHGVTYAAFGVETGLQLHVSANNATGFESVRRRSANAGTRIYFTAHPRHSSRPCKPIGKYSTVLQAAAAYAQYVKSMVKGQSSRLREEPETPQGVDVKASTTLRYPVTLSGLVEIASDQPRWVTWTARLLAGGVEPQRVAIQAQRCAYWHGETIDEEGFIHLLADSTLPQWALLSLQDHLML